MAARAKCAYAAVAVVALLAQPAILRAEEKGAPAEEPKPAAASIPKGSTRAAPPTPAPTPMPKATNRSGAAPRAQGSDGETRRETNVVTTEETEEGVKTYEFGAVEVEGRLRSPQIIYFMRRVRAAFEAGDLGHRSFLRELSDTRRHPAFK